ncbi:hypothetical protein T440DRAFT_193831 [Plenodomus tracheiphilus IPT5]|uniref:Uncharacterized protein n=1 Tax=Plenodomus tracheiphilus IPT5 TaxID=1408161 RepID=A0A6A7AZB7_9PLEO|nr:hypothetical protein T440DRAFT_193831 [Plenodomus tracheiphilus IPT5]
MLQQQFHKTIRHHIYKTIRSRISTLLLTSSSTMCVYVCTITSNTCPQAILTYFPPPKTPYHPQRETSTRKRAKKHAIGAPPGKYTRQSKSYISNTAPRKKKKRVVPDTMAANARYVRYSCTTHKGSRYILPWGGGGGGVAAFWGCRVGLALLYCGLILLLGFFSSAWVGLLGGGGDL